MSEPVVLCEIVDGLKGVAKITLNRPLVHNALDDYVIENLSQAFLEFGEDTTVRVIILAANGQIFSTGADLNHMKRVAAYTFEKNVDEAKKLSRLLDIIDKCSKPTVACIQGAAFGGGVGLIAACDIAICVEEAFFCLSEVKWGLIPAIISPYVINAIGQRQLRRYVVTAERMSAAEALRLGLVHQVVGEGELDATAESLVTSILKGSPDAIKASKELIRFVESRPIDDSIHEETARRIAMSRSSVEGQEGINAFLAKQLPSWIPKSEEG